MEWMLQSKDIGCKNGWKNKADLYAAYKWPILDLKTPTEWKWEDGETSRKWM